MKYLICILAAILVGGVSFCMLNTEIYCKIKFLQPRSNSDNYKIYHQPKRGTAYGVSLFFLIVGGICGYLIGENASDLINAIKILVAMVCVVGSACVDFCEHRIPNFYPGFLAIASILMLILGVVTEQDGAIAYITSSVFSAVACLLILTASALLTKGGIGAGDIKLLCALALAGGVDIICYTVFIGVMLCAIVAAIMLITKQKVLQDYLPFGPFLCVGFVATIIIIF